MPPCEGGYKNFRIGDLFECRTGDIDLQQKDINGKGTYFINSGIQNYGIKGKTDKLARVFPANTITIDFWGNAFYRPFEYKLATHNHVFSLSGESIKNKLVGIYLACTMSYMKTLFSYNNMGTWSIIKDLSILLPTTSNGDIDFAFMESRIRELEEERMRELEEERMRELEAYLAAAGFANCDLTPAEQEALRKFNNQQVNFDKFPICKLFDVVGTKSIDEGKLTFVNNGINFVGRVNDNNGVKGQIVEQKFAPNASKTLTATVIGNYKYVKYQEKPYYCSQNINKLTPLFEIDNNIALYFIANIQKFVSLFDGQQGGYKLPQLQNHEISLPINPNNKEIDYPFMETYISAIKKQTIAALKDFIAREHTAYEQVING